MSSICFLVPGHASIPVGGFKVVYQYASELAARGHRTLVVHPARNLPDEPWRRRPLKWARYLQRALTESWRPDSWLQVDPRVELLWARSLRSRHLPDADVVVATGWHTASWLDDYPAAKGAQIYLVQDYELYMLGDAAVRSRMRAIFRREALTLLAISPAVEGMLADCGVDSAGYLPNGIDQECFYREADGAEERTWVGFPGRLEAHKGTRDAIEALERVRRERPTLRAWSFGYRRPAGLPAWIEFHERPSSEALRGLYNRSSIFLQPSHYEGFGLPGLEAMACGAALISTRCGGAEAYAHHETTALLCAPKAPQELAAGLVRLLGDASLRGRIAEAGHAAALEFTWTRAADRLEAAIQEALLAGRS